MPLGLIILAIQATPWIGTHRVEVDGILCSSNGMNYLVVAEVISDDGIQNLTHKDYGTSPPFSIPDPSA